MPWGPAPTLGLIVPSDAGPNDPAVIIDSPPNLPPDLIAFYTNIGQTVISAIIFRRNATQYNYLADLDSGGFAFMAAGSSLGFPGGGTVKQAWLISTAEGSGNVGAFDVGGVFGASLNLFLSNGAGADFAIAEFAGILYSQARGPRMAVAGAPGISSGNALTTPAAESATFTAWTTGTNSMVWTNGRVYRCTLETNVSNNLAGAMTTFQSCRWQVNVRSNHGALAVVGSTADTSVQNGHLDDDKTTVFYVKNSSGADITAGLGVTITKGFSSIGSSIFLDSASISVEDAGSTLDALGPLAAVMT